MNSHPNHPVNADAACAYLLQFTSLYNRGRGVAVPCDAAGKVDVDSLTQRLRASYVEAQAMVGRDYLFPIVQPVPSSERDRCDYRLMTNV